MRDAVRLIRDVVFAPTREALVRLVALMIVASMIVAALHSPNTQAATTDPVPPTVHPTTSSRPSDSP